MFQKQRPISNKPSTMWQVGGEAFIQRTCETNPITIIELKEKPECEKVEKVKLLNTC